MKFSISSILVAVSLFLAGCTTWATYPPIEEGAIELNDPTLEPIPSLMAEAIRFSYEHYAQGHDVVINLPEGTPAEVYDLVIGMLGAGRPMVQGDSTTFGVLEVRVRALDAEVDIIYPRVGTSHEMATITFHKDLLTYYEVVSSRLWRIRVDPPRPHYVPPAVEE